MIQVKQEDKELLLKDLCARLPYEVKVQYEGNIFNIDYISSMYEEVKLDIVENYTIGVSDIKPYLFPLSSMTEEQKKEISNRYNYYNPYQLCVLITNHRQGCWDNDDNSCDLRDYLWLEDWFNKNHFDYRGLIPMNLAIDATGLNIY